MAAKGCTFMTEEGPGELVTALIDAGFGSTKYLTYLIDQTSVEQLT